jgi:two-component system response regulator FixJ
VNESAGIVHLVDDDNLYLTATSRLLRAHGFTVKTFASGKEFLAQFTGDVNGCLVADLRMPSMSGLDLQEAMKRADRMMPVIFLSAETDIPATVRAMQHGAEDFIEKTSPKEKLLTAVKRALARAETERETQLRLRKLRALFDTLSVREREVLTGVVEGKMNKHIATDLGIGVRTVKAHRTSITTKLRVPSVAELTRLVQDLGQ